jgi:hypothetical protein
MATVEELLGAKPAGTVEDLLGPRLREQGSAAASPPMPGEEIPTPEETFINSSSIGRVLNAFGQGMKQGWGAEPIGMSDTTAKELTEMGLMGPAQNTWMQGFRTFNEAIMRPAGAGLDTLMRAGRAVLFSAGGGLGQAAYEAGLAETPGRATRSLVGMGESALTLAGAMPFGVKPSVRPAAEVPRVTPEMLDAAQDLGVTTGKAPEAKFHEPSAPLVLDGEIIPPGAKSTAEAPAPNALVDKAGNINLNRIQSTDDIKSVIAATAQENDFAGARRGVMTLGETEALAEVAGVTTESLLKRQVGQAFNAEQAVAARNLLVQSATDVRRLGAKAVGGADADMLAFQEAVTRHTAIQEQVSGMTAEAGRALSSFRIAAKGTEDVSALLAGGAREGLDGLARMVGELDTPGQVSKLLIDARKAKTSDMLVEGWINALLSGPQTHATNILSNTLVTLWAVPETATAAMIGKVRTLADVGSAERVRGGEALGRLFGVFQGAPEGLVAGWKTFKTGVPSDVNTKLELRRFESIPSAKISIGGREIEVGGAQIRLPSRALMGEDEVFKAVGYRQELNSLAYRQATKEGLEGEALADRMAELVANPSDKMRDAARENANYQTFNRQLGPMGRAVQAFAASHPAVKFVLPFIRTPTNIIKYAGERTPLAVLSKEVRAEIAKGGAAADMQMARIALGTAVGTTMVYLAANGFVTGGGPLKPQERAVMYLNGWQPYSVKIGGMYYAYNRLDPLGLLMGVSADAYEIGHKLTEPDTADIAALIVGSASKSLINKTWLRGPSELVQAVMDPTRYGDRWVSHSVGTVVPTGVAQIAQTQDPYMREAKGIVDTIKSRVPGMSTDLLPKRDIWGNPIAREGSLGPDLLSPIYESAINTDPLNQELLKLKIWPAKLDKEVRGVKLNEKQYDDLQRIAGRNARIQAVATIQIPGYSNLSEAARREMLVRVIEKARETGRTSFLMQNPDVLKAATEKRMKALAGKVEPAKP